MKYIDLRKTGREGLREIRRQVVRLKEMGKTGKEIEELTGVRQNRASEINMDSVSTRGRIFSNPEKVWAKARDTHGSNDGRTRGYSGSDPRETARGFRNHWQVMDVRPNEAVYPKTME